MNAAPHFEAALPATLPTVSDIPTRSACRYARRSGWIHNGPGRHDKGVKVNHMAPQMGTRDGRHEEESNYGLA